MDVLSELFLDPTLVYQLPSFQWSDGVTIDDSRYGGFQNILLTVCIFKEVPGIKSVRKDFQIRITKSKGFHLEYGRSRRVTQVWSYKGCP